MGDPIPLDLPDGDAVFHPSFFPPADADRLFRELRDTTGWSQQAITFYGKAIDVPRLTAWHADPGVGYTYSGITNPPLPWTPALLEVKRLVEPAAGVAFNGGLCNLYRTGRDSVAWHSDDEPEFGPEPVIASVSFGAVRAFQFRHKKQKELKAGVELTPGSLLVMRGATQHHWLHQVPKTTREVGERINLTFRRVRPGVQ